jgi:hypothetical protein
VRVRTQTRREDRSADRSRTFRSLSLSNSVEAKVAPVHLRALQGGTTQCFVSHRLNT